MKTHIHRTNLQLHLKIPLRYALRHGYDLVPCFTVGDSDMFSWLQESWGHEGQPSKTRPKLQPKQGSFGFRVGKNLTEESVTEMKWKKQCMVILCKLNISPALFHGLLLVGEFLQMTWAATNHPMILNDHTWYRERPWPIFSEVWHFPWNIAHAKGFHFASSCSFIVCCTVVPSFNRKFMETADVEPVWNLWFGTFGPIKLCKICRVVNQQPAALW